MPIRWPTPSKRLSRGTFVASDSLGALLGALCVSIALLAGAGGTIVSAFVSPRPRWLVGSALPAAALYLGFGLVAGFIVKPNERVRKAPYVGHNIALTRRRCESADHRTVTRASVTKRLPL